MNERESMLMSKKKLREKLFKTKGTSEEVNWRKRKLGNKEKRELKLLKKKDEAERLKKDKECEAVSFETEDEADKCSGSSETPAKKLKKDKLRPYNISIAVPGSFLNNAQSAELRAYMAGQVARAATLFCVDEIIIYDETCRLTKEQVDAYWSGSWYGDVHPSDNNLEANMHLCKILEYVECPQYLRKFLFPFHKALKFAGLLNPLDAQHHLKATDLSIPFREGVVLDKPVKANRGPICDVGLDKELQLEDNVTLPPFTRVTIEMTRTGEDFRMFRGRLTNAEKVREACGSYWGYNVSLATCLNEVLDRNKYDVIIGTSPRGQTMGDVHVNVLTRPRILVVFGGVNGVEAAVEADETLSAHSPEVAFDRLVNPLPGKGSRSERVEENILVTLSELTLRMEQLIK